MGDRGRAPSRTGLAGGGESCSEAMSTVPRVATAKGKRLFPGLYIGLIRSCLGDLGNVWLCRQRRGKGLTGRSLLRKF